MHRYAIRKKGTDLYFPAGDVRDPFRKGFSWSEPETNGGPLGPRLFLTLQSARNALSMWCQGCWKNETVRYGEYGSEAETITVPTEPAEPRSMDDFEYVPFRLAEDVSMFIEANKNNALNTKRRARRRNALKMPLATVAVGKL